jgi:threonine/homoserine/homoserine lactone efflux protein
VHVVVASFGVGELLLLYPWLYEILRWIGVTYLLFLAWEGWQTQDNSSLRADLSLSPGPLILRGLLSNVFNPKSVLFLVSVVPTFVGSTPTHPDFPFRMVIFCVVYVGIATTIHVAIVMLAAELRPYLVEGPRRNLVRRILAVALLFVAGWLFWATKRPVV